MTDIVEVVTADDRWAIVDLAHLANRAASLALSASGINSENYEIALLACDDAKIAELNGQYRGKPGPTNILSWPARRLSPVQDGATPKIPAKAAGVL